MKKWCVFASLAAAGTADAAAAVASVAAAAAATATAAEVAGVTFDFLLRERGRFTDGGLDACGCDGVNKNRWC